MRHGWSRLERLAVAAVAVGTYLIAGQLDLLERFLAWSRSSEQFEGDELVVTALTTAIALLVVALRQSHHAARRASDLAARDREHAHTFEQFRSLFEYNPHSVVAFDPDGRYTSANPSSVKLTGYHKSELLTMTFADVVAPEDLPIATETFRAALRGGARQTELKVRHRDGHRVDINVVALPIVLDSAVTGVFVIAENVTERNQLNRELATARAVAEQANAAKSLFLANVSHEIRTPLTSIVAAAEIMLEEPLEDRHRRLMRTLHRSGRRLSGLVSQILDFSKIEADKLELDVADFDPRRLVRDLVDLITPAAHAKGLVIDATIDDGFPTSARGDADQIAQVLGNLLDNAVKFTAEGAVRLRARAEAAASGSGPGDTVLVFTVTDTGVGFAPAEQEKLFEPFTQVDPGMARKYGGTGLGLAISKRLTQLMGGEIEVHSEPGAGSTFTVRIPVSA